MSDGAKSDGAFRAAIAALERPVQLAVDDAGAGFASFRHILELDPAFVKLDRSLVQGIDGDPTKQALVAGMRHFARATHRRLIAEGVETDAEAAALAALDVRLAQGYLFGRPGAGFESLQARQVPTSPDG
jgi:EAL domain-containing protein (putative c-di-GMP-specific phosphodiesterase class I)